MTDTTKLDQALAARGWHYDDKNELFMDGSRQLDSSEVLGLLPGLKQADLVAYQEAKWAKKTPAQQRNSQADM
jgi:hypothetical protein